MCMRQEPETIYVVPIKSDSEHFRRWQTASLRSRTGGMRGKNSPRSAATRLLRERVYATPCPSIRLDPCGIYFGTTGGQVYARRGGDSWSPIVRDLPAVLSVEVQTFS